MFDRFKFYVQHSFNDLRVNARLTAFALLCIAAGVAAIVSLQTLALMIENSLTGSLRENNRGDIQFNPDSGGGGFGNDDEVDPEIADALESGLIVVEETRFFGQGIEEYKLTEQFTEDIVAWAAENYEQGFGFTYRQDLADPVRSFLGGGTGTPTNPETGASAAQAQPRVIEPAVYPFFGEILTPDGTPIGALLNEATDVVINDVLAGALGVGAGDEIALSGADENFTVRGVYAAEAEVTGFQFDTLLAGQFGGYFIGFAALDAFPDINYTPDVGYLRLNTDTTSPEQINELERALRERYPFLDTDTTEDLRRTYESIAANIDQLVTVMGLVSLLLGSIGIINTMQVVVRRRMLEIAVLKTIGLQARQITVLFLIEALLMGIVGSVLGVLLGWATTFIIRGVAEAVFQSPLPFVFAPGPAIAGLVVGSLVTVVFGLLPTLTAGEVRPSVVLRPSDKLLPQAGCLRTLAAFFIMIVLLSLIAQAILGDFTLAVTVVVGSFVAAGALFALLRFIISIIARYFPAFGIVDLKLTLRQIFAARGRAATTLLALVVGVFSLSLITLLAQSVNDILDFALTDAAGGNVLINVQSANQIDAVEDVLTNLDAVNSYSLQQAYNLEFVELRENGEAVSEEALRERLNNAEGVFLGPPAGSDAEEADADSEPASETTEATEQRARNGGFGRFEALTGTLSSVAAVDADDEAERVMLSGRDLNASDAGQPVLVLSNNPFIEAAQIEPGDTLTFAFPRRQGIIGSLLGRNNAGNTEADGAEADSNGADSNGANGAEADGADSNGAQTVTFEVIGISDPAFGFSLNGSSNIAPITAFPDNQSPTQIAFIVDVAEDQVTALRREVTNAVPSAFILETSALTQVLDVLLGTFTAFPTLVALLGLIVGGVVIANSVALTTLERRKEIAIMKAVGLQRGRVLFMLLLENGFLGLIGGLIGVGFGLIGLVIFISTSGAPTQAIPIGTALLLMLLCVFVAVIAAVSAAVEAAGERPLNVLRSE